MSRKAENVVCRASYTQSFFGHFLVSEFFNSHRPYHKLAPFVRWTGERRAQTRAMAFESGSVRMTIWLSGCEVWRLNGKVKIPTLSHKTREGWGTRLPGDRQSSQSRATPGAAGRLGFISGRCCRLQSRQIGGAS